MNSCTPYVEMCFAMQKHSFVVVVVVVFSRVPWVLVAPPVPLERTAMM